MRIKPTFNKATLRILALAITAVMCTLVILSAVFPFPEGQWDFLSIGTGQKALGSPSGWLSGWSYCKEITLSNPVADVPVRLKVGETSGATGEDFDVEGHCSNFPNDIRFTESDEETELYQVIESLTGTAPNRTAIINIGLVDDQKIYCYYGNADAFPDWDMANTFPVLGENFNAYKNYFDNNLYDYGASIDMVGPYGVYVPSLNRTYMVVAGPSGDPYMTYFDHALKTWASRVKVGTNPRPNDAYALPCMVRSSDGYLSVFYGQHSSYSTGIYQTRSTNPDDISTWTDKGYITGYAQMPNVVLASNGDIYLFWIDMTNPVSQTFPQTYAKSTNGGANWSSTVTMIEAVKQGENTMETAWASGNYHVVGNRVPISWTYGVSTTLAIADGVYYAYLNTTDDKVYSVNGTDLGTTVTRTEANTYCRAVSLNSAICRPTRVTLDSTNNPYIIYAYDDEATTKFYFVYWTGSAWSSAQAITTTYSGYTTDGDLTVSNSTSVTAYLPAANYDIEQWAWNGSTWAKTQTIAAATDYDSNLDYPLVVTNYTPELTISFSQHVGSNYNKGFAWGASGFLGDYVGYTTDTELQAVWHYGTLERTTVWEGKKAYKSLATNWPYKTFSIVGNFTVRMMVRFSTAGDQLCFLIWDGTKVGPEIDGGYPNSGYWGYQDSGGWHNSGIANAINTWYYMKVDVDVTGKKFSGYVSTDGVSWSTICSAAPWYDSDSAVNRLSLGHSTASYYDYIRIYKYMATEPAFSSAGSEQGFTVEITNDPDSKDFGVLEVNTTAATTINYFTLNNTGTCLVDVTIQGTDMAGGDDTWQLSGAATPGENIYGLYAGLDDADDNFDVVVNSTANAFVSDLAEATTQAWGLKLYMPTTVSGYDAQQMVGTITLVASTAS